MPAKAITLVRGKKIGITDSLVKLSPGYEDSSLVIDDLEQAFIKIES